MKRRIKPIAERFWPKVDKTETCWIWTAGRTHDGYGFIGLDHPQTGKVYAHRYAYELLVGPIPEGLHLDHLCRVRHCVNPAHLEPVTSAENMARSNNKGAQAIRTDRCWRGHSLADAYITNSGGRQCRVCTKLRAQLARERRAVAAVSS